MKTMMQFPWVTGATTALAVALSVIPGLPVMMQWESGAIVRGELWRLLTGNLVHWNASHLLWDAMMFAIVGTVAEWRSRRGLVSTLVGSVLLITLLLESGITDMTSYRGLSGLDTGLFSFVAAHWLVEALRERDRVGQLAGGAALIGLIAKTILEIANGDTLFVASSGDFVAIPAAHLAGIVAGLGAALAVSIRANAVASARPEPPISLRQLQ